MEATINAIGAIATIIAVAGVLLNNRRKRACFVLWITSNAATGFLHAYTGLWSLLIRDIIFIWLAVEGWRLWGKDSHG